MPGRKHARKLLSSIAAVSLVLAGAALAPRPAPATTIMAEAMTLEFQVTQSDVIVRGVCEDVGTTFSNKNLFTTYKVRVKEYFKAPGKMSVSTHPVISVSQLGGRLEKPLPIAQVYPQMAAMYPGEKVVLFLLSPDNIPSAMKAGYQKMLEKGAAPSPMMRNYRLTTLSVSKLNEVREPNTGKTLIARAPYDQWGVFTSPEIMKSFVESFEAGRAAFQVKQSSGAPGMVPVRLGPLVTQPAADMEGKIRQMSGWCSTVEDFRAQVQTVITNAQAATAPTATVQR